MDGNSNLTNSTVSFMTGHQLVIVNLRTLSEEDKVIQCCEVLNNGMVVEGTEYKVEPLGMYCVLRNVFQVFTQHAFCVLYHSRFYWVRCLLILEDDSCVCVL